MEEKDKMIMTFRFFLVVAVAAVGSMAMAAPSVTVGDVKTGEPWSTITVAYTLSGVDADVDYKIAFDVTANGVTRGVTNAAAKLTDGMVSKTIDTADPRAAVDAAWRIAVRKASIRHVMKVSMLAAESKAIYRAYALEGGEIGAVAERFGVTRNTVSKIKMRVDRMVAAVEEAYLE